VLREARSEVLADANARATTTGRSGEV
jgi:hypothetical protein